MRFPLSLNLSMAHYLVGQRISGREKFPLVLMLEPTHKCNLQCKGCGRIREYKNTLDKELTLEECLEAVDVTGTPVVTITGGEPLLYSRVKELVRSVLDKGRHIFFCTNGMLLEDALEDFKPSKRFFWNVHFDGTARVHDSIIGRDGGFDKALKAVKKARKVGFQVTTNTTVYRETDISDLEKLFEILTAADVNGILVAPGFSYTEVEDEIFLNRKEITEKFKVIRKWIGRFPIMSNPIYLDFCAGLRTFNCTPWGNPTRNPVGWKSPCYLITDAHYPTFRELMEKTNWDYYVSGKDPRCQQCMVHCGYEPTIVRTLKGKDLVRMIFWNFGLIK
ncbi:MAG: adenosyl-hopene transferase HpnH [Deltaproteobacteria bacterium]|nr:adenosyl-hopene transferase HpnH [Deltaproteobacteria bacterium]MBW2067405.1 adenosyl-hopene transferase HpnH [Deltaproteobacteria bacterium]